MKAIINVGLILERVRQKGWSGIDEASKNCRVGPKSFARLMGGEIPRLDAFFRICNGLGISPQEVCIRASSLKTEKRPRGDLVSGRWEKKNLAQNQH